MNRTATTPLAIGLIALTLSCGCATPTDHRIEATGGSAGAPTGPSSTRGIKASTPRASGPQGSLEIDIEGHLQLPADTVHGQGTLAVLDRNAGASLLAQQFRDRDPVIWPQRVMVSAQPERIARLYAELHDGLSPTALSDLSPYLFSWPYDGPEMVNLAPVLDRADLGRRRYSAADPGLFLGVWFEGPDMVVSRPEPVEAGEWRLREQRYALGASRPMRLGPGLQRQPLVPAEPERVINQWSGLRESGSWVVTPFEGRYLAVGRELENLLVEAQRHTLQLPTTLQELTAGSGQALLNLLPANSGQEEVTLEFDGSRAYRITVRYPSGYVEDTVVQWMVLDSAGSAARTLCYEAFMRESGATFRTLGAWRLAQGREITMPPSG